MLRVGIVGTGLIAREHARSIAMVPQSVSLVAVADISSERLAEFARTFSVARRYGSAAALIADPQVDLVTIATPPALHEEAVIAALDAGKYVLCEKPLAQSLASAEQIAGRRGAPILASFSELSTAICAAIPAHVVAGQQRLDRRGPEIRGGAPRLYPPFGGRQWRLVGRVGRRWRRGVDNSADPRTRHPAARDGASGLESARRWTRAILR